MSAWEAKRYCAIVFFYQRICIMKYGFIRKFCRFMYHTLVQNLRLHSLLFVVPFWNAFFGTQYRNGIESWNNQCILEYILIASIVPGMG